MSTALAIYTPPDDERGDPIADPAALKHAREVSAELAAADLLPPHFHGKPANVLIALALARRMGEDPLYILQSMSVVQGRPCWSAQFVIARANRSGVFRGPIRWREEGSGDGLAVTAYATVAETGDEVSFTVSLAMAKADGWAGRNKKYASLPTLMLRYRSAVLLVRLHAPEVLSGYHERDELVDAGLEDRSAQRARPPAIEADPDPAASANWRPRPQALEAEVEPANPSSPSPQPEPRGEPGAASGGGQVEAQAQPQTEAPKRATQAQGRAWRERLAAWRAAAELEPLDPEVVADLCEALGNGRPSTLPLEKQEQLLGWLDYPEGKGMARYRAIAAERAEALAAARSLSVADRRRAAERAGVGTAPAELTLIELQRLGQAALDLGIGVDGDGVAEGEHAEEEPAPWLVGWSDPGTPEGDALEMAIGDCELATTEDEQRQAAEAAGLRWMADAGAVTEGVPEPQLRRYLAALRVGLPE